MPCSTLIIIDDNLFWLVFIPLLLLLLVSLLFVQIKIRILFFGCWGFDRFSIQSQTDFFVFSYGTRIQQLLYVCSKLEFPMDAKAYYYLSLNTIELWFTRFNLLCFASNHRLVTHTLFKWSTIKRLNWISLNIEVISYINILKFNYFNRWNYDFIYNTMFWAANTNKLINIFFSHHSHASAMYLLLNNNMPLSERENEIDKIYTHAFEKPLKR